MSVQEYQNLPGALDKLAAQRLLYRRAKRIRIIGMVTVFCIAVFALVASVVQNKEFSYGVMIAALITWFFGPVVSEGVGD